ncbi:MAG: XRE family transcriptional regulator [Cetobacterium sp.]
MELSIVLKKLRESRGLSIKKLAEIAGVGNGTIGEIERGKNSSKPITLEKIAIALDLNKNEREELFGTLLSNKQNKIQNDFSEVKSITPRVVELPVYGKASAGNGYLNMSNILRTEYISILPGEDFPKGTFIIEVCGESMFPTLLDGDLVIVDPNCNEHIHNQICVITYNEETYIKRVLLQNDFIILMSDNPDRVTYKDIIIPKNTLSPFICHGIVIERRTKFKKR